MSAKNAIDIVLSFVEQINEHNVAGLCDLMSEDHIFVDSLGKIVRGRESMRTGWQGYFRLFPDYRISCTEIIQQGESFALFGTARGTYEADGQLLEENKWEVPAAWKAVVRDGLLAEWRVFADNYKTVRMIKGL